MKASSHDTNHERFGELSALALIGELSPEECQELSAHLKSCVSCRDEYGDFAAILETQLPLLHQPPMLMEDGPVRIEDGPVEATKFVFGNLRPRAQSGFPRASSDAKGRGLSRPPAALPLWVAAAGLALLGMVALLGFEVHRYGLRESTLQGALAAANAETQRLRDHAVSSPPLPVMPGNAAANANNKSAAKSAFAVHALQAQLNGARAELQQLKQELENRSGEEAQAVARAHDSEERLEKTSRALAGMTQERDRAVASSEARQQEIASLTQEVAATRDAMDRDRELLAHDRDIRDLMGARNLRIIDIFDVDGEGRTRKPFGRLFLTEGKSLVFYAFDLDRRKPSMRAAAFQGWGSKSPDQSAARSLGVFYRDDQHASSWILKVDDPGILAEIDSVFVTVEPPGGSRKPTGTHFLETSLKTDMNHP